MTPGNDRFPRLAGLLPAAVTPLTADGGGIDEAGVEALAEFYVGSGVDGIFVAGTTGEGLLLTLPERITLARRFLEATDGRVPVVVHAGAQTTSDTIALAENAAALGAAAVAVVGPPFFDLDEQALLTHFSMAARACAPVRFVLYEIRHRTGYAIPASVVEKLREEADNLVGIKVSDPDLDDVKAYLPLGLDVFVGAERLVQPAMGLGAVGAVSGLAAALPGPVARLLQPGKQLGEWISSLRVGFSRFPFHAALKVALAAQGVPIEPAVRSPLRCLTPVEAIALHRWLSTDVLA